jgi:hypothetical protein
MPTPQEVALNQALSNGQISTEQYLAALNQLGTSSQRQFANTRGDSDQSIGALLSQAMAGLGGVGGTNRLFTNPQTFSAGRVPFSAAELSKQRGLTGQMSNPLTALLNALRGGGSSLGSAGKSVGGAIARHPVRAGIGALGAGLTGKSVWDEINKGSTSESNGNYTRSRPGGLTDEQVFGAGGGAGGAGGSATGNPQLDAILEMMMAGGAGGRYDTPADTMNAESNRMQAMAQDFAAKARASADAGNLQLAREQFADSQIWSERAANATDTGNQLRGESNQTERYGAMGNLYAQTEASDLGRAGMKARGAEGLGKLVETLGTLGKDQADLQLKIMSTPRNAIAGAMMGRGQNPGPVQGPWMPTNLLGFDPSTLPALIAQAQQAMSQVGQMQAPTFDPRQIMSGLNFASQSAQQMMPQSMIPAQPNQPGAMQVAQRRLPQPPANGGMPTSYQAVLDRMRAGGAPQMAIDSFLQGANAEGYR